MSVIVGKTIEKERKKAGLKQTELAKMTGVSRSAIAMVETYERDLHTDELKRIADVLGVSASYLLTGDDDENRKCAADELGFSNETINAIRNMDDDALKAIELLINDPFFSMAWKSYLSTGEQGLWRNGQKIASEGDSITLGSYEDYGGAYDVGSLVSYAREQDIISTIRRIKGSGKR